MAITDLINPGAEPQAQTANAVKLLVLTASERASAAILASEYRVEGGQHIGTVALKQAHEREIRAQDMERVLDDTFPQAIVEAARDIFSVDQYIGERVSPNQLRLAIRAFGGGTSDPQAFYANTVRQLHNIAYPPRIFDEAAALRQNEEAHSLDRTASGYPTPTPAETRFSALSRLDDLITRLIDERGHENDASESLEKLAARAGIIPRAPGVSPGEQLYDLASRTLPQDSIAQLTDGSEDAIRAKVAAHTNALASNQALRDVDTSVRGNIAVALESLQRHQATAHQIREEALNTTGVRISSPSSGRGR